MATQTPLLPTLYSLLPSTSHPSLLAQLSLLAIHSAPYSILDTLYTALAPVIANQQRTLRLRHDILPSPTYHLTYLSKPLSSREYAEMSVQACVGVDIEGLSAEDEIDEFIETLGFKQTHSYTLKGTIFHFPLPSPNLTLTMTITRMNTPPVEPGDGETSEPWLIHLQPSKPVSGVTSNRGELNLNEMMNLMKGFIDRIDGLEWSSGRDK
ncbi:hypothetical protein P7C73_g5680, partial [Tremellales sp. Uapishka_1]